MKGAKRELWNDVIFEQNFDAIFQSVVFFAVFYGAPLAKFYEIKFTASLEQISHRADRNKLASTQISRLCLNSCSMPFNV